MVPRIVIAKPGLDGHDRGAKIIARALRDAGFEVIYLGLRNPVERIAAVAIDEDAAVVGLSVLSGSHLALTRKMLTALSELDAADIPVVVGGTVPPRDVPALIELGAAAVFPTSTKLDEVVKTIRKIVDATAVASTS